MIILANVQNLIFSKVNMNYFFPKLTSMKFLAGYVFGNKKIIFVIFLVTSFVIVFSIESLCTIYYIFESTIIKLGLTHTEVILSRRRDTITQK